MSRRALVILATVTLLVPVFTASCAPRRVSAAGEAAFDDATISTRVKTVLLNDPDVGARRIEVSTQQGVVTLSGVARTEAEAQKALTLARGVRGVRDVRSALKVEK